jgi:hypothetical protein
LSPHSSSALANRPTIGLVSVLALTKECGIGVRRFQLSEKIYSGPLLACQTVRSNESL